MTLGPFAFAVTLLLPLPQVSWEAHGLVAIYGWTVTYWVTEALPVAAPLAIGAVVEEIAGVERSQLVQEDPRTVRLRLALAPDADSEAIWAQAIHRLSAYLAEQGATEVEIRRGNEPPQVIPHSGKFRQVIGR